VEVDAHFRHFSDGVNTFFKLISFSLIFVQAAVLLAIKRTNTFQNSVFRFFEPLPFYFINHVSHETFDKIMTVKHKQIC